MIKILYAGYGEIGVLGLSKIFSDELFDPSNIFILSDLINEDLLMFEYSKKYNLNLISSSNLNKIKINFDVCVSVHWRKKITKEILSKCKKGGINLHPSLLPKYAGCSSLAWAIINQEEFAGFTWHQINDDFDKGEIVFQYPIKINSFDTAFSLWNKVNCKGVEIILEVIKIFLSEDTLMIKQDLTKRSYFKRGFPTFKQALKINQKLDLETYERASHFPGKK